LFVSLRARRPAWSRLLVAMILGGVIAGLASNMVKLATGRVRPRVQEVAQGWYGPRHEGEWVSLQHNFQAFPSSHAAAAFGFFVPLALSRRVAGGAGLAAAALISWSRIQLNAHYVSDAAAGALLGVLAGWLAWRWIVAGGGLSRWLRPPVNT
jgi:membrane-associated phospholipid phosphatase